MGESVHGHDVLNMMLGAGRTFEHEELIQAIQEKFGTDARFHTCSAEGMDAEALVAFLQARGKFTGENAGLQADPDRICKD